MKPRVFLSHNKKDKGFIERLANDLRSCGIDVWYDEWEIPPGGSLRKKIFDEGLTSCDVFFVYLTANSISSKWVQTELDSAFVHEMNGNSDFMILYVDQDTSRDALSIDLKALNIPKFNPDDYAIPFGKLLSKTWKTYFKKQFKNQDKENRIRILELENEVLELKNKVLNLQQSSVIDVDSLKTKFENQRFVFDSIELNLFIVFENFRMIFAVGCHVSAFKDQMESMVGISESEYSKKEIFWQNYTVADFIGEFVLAGLIRVEQSSEGDRFYYLTKEGIEFAKTF